MALRLGVDLDGVLANFRHAFRETARSCLRHAPSALSPKDIDRVWAHIARTPNWWTTLEAYEPEAIARLYGLARASHWEVFFLTKRPPSAGESVQFQAQWWLEQRGFFFPAVLTVPGSRGELAHALRLDLLIDDQLLNCAEVIGAGQTKTILMLRDPDPAVRTQANERGIGVVTSFAEAIAAIERLEQALPARAGKPLRLKDWFGKTTDERLPLNPRAGRPVREPGAKG